MTLPSVVDPQPVADPKPQPETLRPLSPLERVFDAIDQINGLNFSIAVSFKGKVEHSRWIAAFAQLQQRHPFLNARLNHDDMHAPFLHRAEGAPIPLTFGLRTSPTQWERVIESHIEEPFTAPLVRATLLEDKTGCDLIFTTHHTILDGVGSIALLRDLLAALAGEALTPLPLPPCAEDRTAQIRLTIPPPPPDPQAAEAAEAWMQFLATRPARAFARHSGTRRPVISSLRVSPEETSRWLTCARKQQVTLTAMLLAALASAARELDPSRAGADIHIAVPVNARPWLNSEDDAVLCISIRYLVCLHPDAGLWESARALRAQLAPAQGLDAMQAYLARVSGVMDMKLDTKVLIDALASQYGTDATMTNLKHVDFPRLPGSLTVEAVWGPAVSTMTTNGFTVGAATVNAALHLVYTTYTPLPGLLETMHRTISQACAS